MLSKWTCQTCNCFYPNKLRQPFPDIMRILRYFGFSTQSISSLSTNLHLKRSSWKHIWFVDLEKIHKHIISINSPTNHQTGKAQPTIATVNPPCGPWTHVTFPWLRSLLNFWLWPNSGPVKRNLDICIIDVDFFICQCNHVDGLGDFWYDQKIYLGKKLSNLSKSKFWVVFLNYTRFPSHPLLHPVETPHQLSQVESFDSKLSRSSWIRLTDQARFDGDADSHRSESCKTLSFMN